MASESEASCVSDPNFAVICSFLECFGKSCGLDYPDISRLQEMLDNVQEVPQNLIDLHIKLLRKLRKSVAPEKWERALVKFCHSYSNQDGWELERFGYKKARVAVKLRLLKALLEAQFDLNQRFKNEINKLSAKELRVEPLGRDKTGLAYWCQLDDQCNIRVYREDLDEENWELVAKDREGMIGLISVLSDGEVGALPLSEDSNSAESIDQPTIDTGQDEAMENDEESLDESNNDTQTKSKTKPEDKNDEEEADDEEESGEDEEDDDENEESDEEASEDETKEEEQIKSKELSSDDGKPKEKLDIKERSKEETPKEEIKVEDQSVVKVETKDNNVISEKVKPIETSVITTPTKLVKPETPTKPEPAELTKSPAHNKLPIKPIDQLAANLVRIQSEKLEKQPKSLENIAKNLAKSSQLMGSRNGLDLSASARYENDQPVDFSGMDLSSRSKTESIDLSAGYRAQDKEMDLSTKKPPSKAEIGYDPRAVMMRNHAMVADLSKRQAPFAGFDISAGYHNSGRLPKEEHRLPSYSILPDPSKIAALRMGSSPIKRPLEEGASMIKRLRADALPIRPIDEKDWRAEVGEPIEEPLMMVQGEGQGQDCESVNPEIGEAVEEPVMFFFGEGSGRDCDAGNPGDDESGDNKESSESKAESKILPDNSLVNNVANKTVQLSKDVDTTDHCSVSSESTAELSKPKFKPSLGVQVIAKSNQGVERISRWDVGKPDEKQCAVSSQADISEHCKPGVPEIATNCADKLLKISRDDECTSDLSANQKESDGSASPPRFFFGPNCISYTPKFEKPVVKRPEPIESKTIESTDVSEQTDSTAEKQVLSSEPSSVAETKVPENIDVPVETTKEASEDLISEPEDQSNKVVDTCETETSNLPQSKETDAETVDEIRKEIETKLELESPLKVDSQINQPMEVEGVCSSKDTETESQELEEERTEVLPEAEKCESTKVPMVEESRTEVNPDVITSTEVPSSLENLTDNLEVATENEVKEFSEEKNNAAPVEEQNEGDESSSLPGKEETKYMELTENNLKECNKGFTSEILSGNTSLVANYASSESNVSDDVFMNDRDGEFTNESKMSDVVNETESLKSSLDDREIENNSLPEYRCNSENEKEENSLDNFERAKVSSELENNVENLETNEISQPQGTEELSTDVSSFQTTSIDMDVGSEKPELQENFLQEKNILEDQSKQDHMKEESPVVSLPVQMEVEKKAEEAVKLKPTEVLGDDKLDDENISKSTEVQNKLEDESISKPTEVQNKLEDAVISRPSEVQNKLGEEMISTLTEVQNKSEDITLIKVQNKLEDEIVSTTTEVQNKSEDITPTEVQNKLEDEIVSPPSAGQDKLEDITPTEVQNKLEDITPTEVQNKLEDEIVPTPSAVQNKLEDEVVSPPTEVQNKLEDMTPTEIQNKLEDITPTEVQNKLEDEIVSTPTEVQNKLEDEVVSPSTKAQNKLEDEIMSSTTEIQNEVFEKPVEELKSLPPVLVSKEDAQKDPEFQSPIIIEQSQVQTEEKLPPKPQELEEKKVHEVQQVDDKIKDEIPFTVELDVKSNVDKVAIETSVKCETKTEEQIKILQNEVSDNLPVQEAKNEICESDENKIIECKSVQPSEVQSEIDVKKDEPALIEYKVDISSNKVDDSVPTEVSDKVEELEQVQELCTEKKSEESVLVKEPLIELKPDSESTTEIVKNKTIELPKPETSAVKLVEKCSEPEPVPEALPSKLDLPPQLSMTNSQLVAHAQVTNHVDPVLESKIPLEHVSEKIEPSVEKIAEVLPEDKDVDQKKERNKRQGEIVADEDLPPVKTKPPSAESAEKVLETLMIAEMSKTDDTKDEEPNEPANIAHVEPEDVESDSDGVDNDDAFAAPDEDPLAIEETDKSDGCQMKIRVKPVSELVYSNEWKMDSSDQKSAEAQQELEEVEPPVISRPSTRSSRKRRSSAPEDEQKSDDVQSVEEVEAPGGKKMKLRGKKTIDHKLKKTVEESRVVTISSEDETSKATEIPVETIDDNENEKKEGDDDVMIIQCNDNKIKRGRPKGRKRRGKGFSKIKSKPAQKQVTEGEDKETKSNDKEVEIIGESVEESVDSIDTSREEKKGEKKRKKRKMLLGLEIDTTAVENQLEDPNDPPVRQSRRIAQLKIQEQRRIEQETMEKQKEQGTKDKKKRKKKADTTEEEDEEEEEEEVVVDQDKGKKKKRKRRKKKKDAAKFNPANAWRSSSGSSSTNEDANDEEDEDEDDLEESDGSILFKSDHEFSPESDLEKDEVAEPMRRARTARKSEDVEEADDEYACQKCGKSDHPEWILLCDKCDQGWHCSCLGPALMLIPEGDWFCPPCQHNSLIMRLQARLKSYDTIVKKHENEILRKKRLVHVGISMENIIHKKESARSRTNSGDDSDKGSDDSNDDDDEDDSSSSSGSSSDSSSSDESEPVYQLRERRCANTYKFNEYDDMINAAIQEEVEAVQGAGNQGRGKDISTIVDAEKEESQVEVLKIQKSDDNEDFEEKAEKESDEDYEEEKDEDEEEETQKAASRKLLSRKKHRKLNSLDISSEEDDPYSDEDFKGTSEEDEEDFEDAGSSEDSSLAGRRGKRGDPRAVRRSTRTRTMRYDEDFINDDSDESDRPKRKKSKSHWNESEESEDSEASWKQRKKRSKTVSAPRSRTVSTKSKSKKKKKRKRIIESEQSDNEEEEDMKASMDADEVQSIVRPSVVESVPAVVAAPAPPVSQPMQQTPDQIPVPQVPVPQQPVPELYSQAQPIQQAPSMDPVEPVIPPMTDKVGTVLPPVIPQIEPQVPVPVMPAAENINVDPTGTNFPLADEFTKKRKKEYKKKSPAIRRKIIYGGLPDDNPTQEEETPGRRTRGRKVNYQLLASDSDEELKKALKKTEESEDEFVMHENQAGNDGEDKDSDSGDDTYSPQKGSVSQKKVKKLKKSRSPSGKRRSYEDDGTPKVRKKPGPKPGSENKPRPQPRLSLTPILNDDDDMLKTMDIEGIDDAVRNSGMAPGSGEGSLTGLAELDDEQLEQMMMEDEEYGRRQLEIAAIEIQKKKKKEEREAKKMEKARLKALEILAAEQSMNAQEGCDGEVPKKKKRGRRSKAEILAEQMRRDGTTNPTIMTAEMSSPPIMEPQQPVVPTNPMIPMTEAALFHPEGTPLKPKRRGRGKGKKTLALEAARAAEAAAKGPGEIGMMGMGTDSNPDELSIMPTPGGSSTSGSAPSTPPSNQSAGYPNIPPNQQSSVITRMLQSQPVAPGAAQPFAAAAAAMGHKYFGTNASPGPMMGSPRPGYEMQPRGRIPSPYRQPGQQMPPHFAVRPGTPPMRMRVPGPQMYHTTHHQMDPSPSGGGPISIDNRDSRSPLGLMPKGGPTPPPPPYARAGPPLARFPDAPQLTARHQMPPFANASAHALQQPSPPPSRPPGNFSPYHPPPPPNYHYGAYPPPPPMAAADDAAAYQGSPYPADHFSASGDNQGPPIQAPPPPQPPGPGAPHPGPPEQHGPTEEGTGEFGGLVSYFSSQREDDLESWHERGLGQP